MGKLKRELFASENWKKAALALEGGCGTSLKTLFDHPDLKSVLRHSACENEISFSIDIANDGSIWQPNRYGHVG